MLESSARRHFANGWRNRRLRTQRGNLHFHLALAFVAGSLEEGGIIRVSQVRREQRDVGQREVADNEQFKNSWETPRCSGGFDARIRRVLGEMQYACAVDEERRTPLASIYLPRVYFRERRYEASGRQPLFCSKTFRLGEESVVCKVFER